MTTHETVNRRYAEIQILLRDNFGAEGRGVGEMVRSIESKLPATLAWEIRAIAHIRNKVVHEGLVEIPRYFEPLCVEAVAAMKRLKPKKPAPTVHSQGNRPQPKPAKPPAKPAAQNPSAAKPQVLAPSKSRTPQPAKKPAAAKTQPIKPRASPVQKASRGAAAQPQKPAASKPAKSAKQPAPPPKPAATAAAPPIISPTPKPPPQKKPSN